MTKRDKLRLLSVLVLALGVRAVVVWGCKDVDAVYGDGVLYFNDAADILAGKTYTGSRAPGNSAIIAVAQFIYPADKIRAFHSYAQIIPKVADHLQDSACLVSKIENIDFQVASWVLVKMLLNKGFIDIVSTWLVVKYEAE